MSEQSAVEDSIKYCIEKNGFPEKSVRLPFKAIHESCKKHNSSLKEVLANLAQNKIIGTMQGDFISFRSSNKLPQKQKSFSKTSDASQTNLPDIENFKETVKNS